MQVNDSDECEVNGSGQQRSRLETLLLCAGFGGMLFFAVFTLLGAMIPGYSFGRDTISALELTHLGWAQQGNFFVFGGSLLAFAAGLRREIGGGQRGSVILPVLQGLSGAGVVGAGVFVNPPLHLVCDLVAFNSAVAVLGVFVWFFWADPRWRGWRAYSAGSAVLMMCLLAGFGAANHPGGSAGLFEKLATATRVAWSTILVYKLLGGATLRGVRDGALRRG